MERREQLAEAFNNTLSDLYCIDWSETDGSDVKEILRKAFTDWKNDKDRIILMFEETTKLNKFQKSVIQQTLRKIA